MSNSEVLSSDPLGKIQTIFHPHNDDSGTFTLEERQDVTDLIDTNKRLYNEVDERARFGNGIVRVASIPMNIFLQAWKQGRFRGSKLSKEDRAWLNDSDNKAFRTRPGRL